MNETSTVPGTTSLSDKIEKSEWRFVWTIIAIVLALTSLPYLYAYVSNPPDKQFMGLILNVPDHGQYLSWWKSFQSSLLVSNKLTPEPNRQIFFNLLWWVLAQVSKWTGLGYAPVYQAFRWVAGGLFLWTAYRLIAQFLPDARRRQTAFLLVSFSSGLGWALVILKYAQARSDLPFPLDVYIAEGNSFLCILGYPHFAMAAAFIALVFEFTWRGWRQGRLRYMVVAGVLGLLLAWMHAYDLLLIYSILAVFALLIWLKQRAFPWRFFWGSVIVFALSCSGPIYSVILTTADPLWKKVLAQFANAGVYTPTPPHMLILFGFPLLIAVAALIGLIGRKQWSEENLFIAGWFTAGAVLNYVPTDFQIHMLNSWQIPMMLLATIGLYDFIAPAIAHRQWLARQQATRWGITALLVVVLPTNIYLWAWRFVEMDRHDYPYYFHHDEVAALQWLSENTPPQEIVFSSLTVGQYIPGLSGNTAFLAHWAETVDFYDKQKRVARFFDPAAPDQERAETLQTFGVGYIFYGPAERELGRYNPAALPWLTQVFSTPQVSIFRVAKDKLPPVVASGGTP